MDRFYFRWLENSIIEIWKAASNRLKFNHLNRNSPILEKMLGKNLFSRKKVWNKPREFENFPDWYSAYVKTARIRIDFILCFLFLCDFFFSHSNSLPLYSVTFFLLYNTVFSLFGLFGHFSVVFRSSFRIPFRAILLSVDSQGGQKWIGWR